MTTYADDWQPTSDEFEALPELPLTWGQLVADDWVWSVKAGKWFQVLESMPKGRTARVRLKHVPQPMQLPVTTPAKVKRSPMGQTVDMFATVLYSGPGRI